MQKSIERVCNLEVEFWTHLTSVVPGKATANHLDLNTLNDFGLKIFQATMETDEFWKQLSKINPNYTDALIIYGEYLRDIRNHPEQGRKTLERVSTPNVRNVRSESSIY